MTLLVRAFADVILFSILTVILTALILFSISVRGISEVGIFLLVCIILLFTLGVTFSLPNRFREFSKLRSQEQINTEQTARFERFTFLFETSPNMDYIFVSKSVLEMLDLMAKQLCLIEQLQTATITLWSMTAEESAKKELSVEIQNRRLDFDNRLLEFTEAIYIAQTFGYNYKKFYRYMNPENKFYEKEFVDKFLREEDRRRQDLKDIEEWPDLIQESSENN